MKILHIPLYHPDDPECPWTDEYNPETIADDYWDEADRQNDLEHEM